MKKTAAILGVLCVFFLFTNQANGQYDDLPSADPVIMKPPKSPSASYNRLRSFLNIQPISAISPRYEAFVIPDLKNENMDQIVYDYLYFPPKNYHLIYHKFPFQRQHYYFPNRSKLPVHPFGNAPFLFPEPLIVPPANFPNKIPKME